MESKAQPASPEQGRRPELPAEFGRYTRAMMGEALYETFSRALSETPPASIRLNRLKCPWHPAAGRRVPWCGCGYYLDERPVFTFDPLLHAGCYYVQEASSMFVHHVIEQYVSRPVLMLDLCAAPGGKSTAAVGALPPGSVLVSNEPVRQRAQILAENMQKWGSPDVIVTNGYPKDFVRSGLTFDVILCDVPCSGEGMFRKDDGAVDEWSPQNVEHCRLLQREIVEAAWQCLAPGGLMIYSTCTFNTAENEENIRWACSELGAEVMPVSIGDDWDITGSLLPDFTAPVFRFIPGRTRGEGLFCAVMRKGDGEHRRPLPASSKGRSRDGSSSSSTLYNIASTWTSLFSTTSERSGGAGGPVSSPSVRQVGADVIIALPERLVPVYDALCRVARVLSGGVMLGRVKGRDIIPDQSLALSAALRREAFPSVELAYDRAIAYLRKEAFTLPEDTPRGFVLVTYRDVPLGFMKNVGTRANNLYPQEWKIKSTYVPDMPQDILA